MSLSLPGCYALRAQAAAARAANAGDCDSPLHVFALPMSPLMLTISVLVLLLIWDIAQNLLILSASEVQSRSSQTRVRNPGCI